MITTIATPQVQIGSRRKPKPPRSLQTQKGTQKAVVTWNADKDIRGLDGWRVYADSVILSTINDPNTRRIEVSITANSSKLVEVSAFTSLGRNLYIESARIPIIASSNTDKYVVTGTSGETGGTSPSSPPEYGSEPSGGKGDFLLNGP